MTSQHTVHKHGSVSTRFETSWQRFCRSFADGSYVPPVHKQREYERREQRICDPCRRLPAGMGHGSCTDPFSDRGECYCSVVSEGHRLIHESWVLVDDDGREGADGLDSSRQTVAWQEDEQAAQDWADRIGDPQ